MDIASSNRPSSLRSPHPEHLDLARKLAALHGPALHRNYGRGLIRVAIDERRFWQVGFLSVKHLDVLGLMAKGFTEEDATTIVHEVQTYDLEGNVPVLVTEPGWAGKKWSYAHCGAKSPQQGY